MSWWILAGVVALAAWLTDRLMGSKRRRLSREEREENIRIKRYLEKPARTIAVPLRECRVVSRTGFCELPMSSYDQYYDMAFVFGGNYSPKRQEQEWTRIEWTGEYKAVPKKFVGPEIPMGNVAFKMKIFEHINDSSGNNDGTTALAIFEDEWGELLGYAFDLGFLR